MSGHLHSIIRTIVLLTIEYKWFEKFGILSSRTPDSELMLIFLRRSYVGEGCISCKNRDVMQNLGKVNLKM